MENKSTKFTVYSHCTGYISIPYSRLTKMINVGDIIFGSERFLCTSASYTQFRITFVDHWGVYAVPTEEYLAKLSHRKKDKEWYSRAKGHHKFKWCNITAIEFQ